MGESREEIITTMGRSVRKWKKWELDDLYMAMKAELKRIEQLRADGVTGPIEIVNYC